MHKIICRIATRYDSSGLISLRPWHEVSVYPKRDLPFFTVLTALLFFITIVLAIVTHQYPKEFIQPLTSIANLFFGFIDSIYSLVPDNVINLLASKPVVPPSSDSIS
ncbi:hypothetical protein X798_07655 [Onchocerca flexuosa]|uniref:Uncharacterized protein n=1 Tax=Onchocerca flexuosa TaxID=387005 RepID=A0A238BJD3_9BILA|nr:hypothetical protein X798_07655 [Onchocerca flexuosa]